MHEFYLQFTIFHALIQVLIYITCIFITNLILFEDNLDSDLASQPTLSRFENSLSNTDVYRMSIHWLDNYVSSIDPKRKRIIIDADGTDDPTHGNQQLSMYNGYYKQFMYNELLIHDGETGQVILPVLRPGSCHSGRWFVHILTIIVDKIRARFPEKEIIIRADSGFSGAKFYKLAEKKNLKFCIGLTRNERLKKFTEIAEKTVREGYYDQGEKFQFFAGAFEYKADSWEKPQRCYAKIESTGKGMNVRYFCSNMEGQTARELYWDFYVKRGETSENRIKELKNMCFSDRLSCHSFVANYFRLFTSCLCYELFRMIKELIRKSGKKDAAKWQISNIRLYLMKVGATIRRRVRRITVCFSKSYVCRELFCKIAALC
ncbi:MAG: IS1380 family transposase [Thermodesulfobacteriota bacterium]|nr:IS1380 family transposase [Thermodesulfobacteriota bacterium]